MKSFHHPFVLDQKNYDWQFKSPQFIILTNTAWRWIWTNIINTMSNFHLWFAWFYTDVLRWLNFSHCKTCWYIIHTTWTDIRMQRSFEKFQSSKGKWWDFDTVYYATNLIQMWTKHFEHILVPEKTEDRTLQEFLVIQTFFQASPLIMKQHTTMTQKLHKPCTNLFFSHCHG